jgi:hypothetical protein
MLVFIEEILKSRLGRRFSLPALLPCRDPAKFRVQAEPITKISPVSIRGNIRLRFIAVASCSRKIMAAVSAGTQILPTFGTEQGTAQGFGVFDWRSAIPAHDSLYYQK